MSPGDASGAVGAAIGRARAWLARMAVPALAAVGVLAPLAWHWFAGRTFVWFDSQSQYEPQRWIVEEALRAFRFPLWNPYQGGGMPLLAGAIHGVLHPVSVLAAWLGTGRSLDVLMGGYVLLGTLGAWLLSRDLGASPAGAAVAAAVYGASGFMFSMTAFPNLLAGAGSLPWCIAGLRRFALAASAGTLALGVGGAAILALSGDPQALLVGGAISFVLAVQAAGWRGAARALAAGGVGLLVAGAQLVPSAVNMPRTVRAVAEWDAESIVWPLEPWRVPELVLPGLLRGDDPLMDRLFGELAGRGHWPPGNLPFPFATSVFVGLLPISLAVVGVRAARLGRVLGVTALALLWIGLGPALGADAVLAHVPLWRSFRYAEKLVGPLTLVLGLLAGFGADAAAERRVSPRTLLGVAVALGVAAIGAFHLSTFRLGAELAATADSRLLRGASHALATLGALGAWTLLRRRAGPRAAGTALAALAWISTSCASPAALHPGDPTARLASPGPPLGPSPSARIVTPYTYEPETQGPTRDWIDQEAREHAAKAYPAHNVRFRLDSLSTNDPVSSRRLKLVKGLAGARWPVVARRYGVTHVIVDLPRSELHRSEYGLAVAGGQLQGVTEGGGEIWAVPHREWASFAPEVLSVPAEGAALDATLRAFAGDRAAVVVEARGAFANAPGRVLSISRGLESLRVEAASEADATLVIQDAWWPGWEATIDGSPTTIFRADALVRAVRWPAGRHVLEMRYSPPEVRVGVAVSALGAALAAAWALILRRAAKAASASSSAAPTAESANPARTSGGS